MSISDQEALDYHSCGRHGKIETVPTKPCLTQRDLSAIIESFVSTLRVSYHPRLEYPQPTEAEKRRALSLVRLPFRGATFPQETPPVLDIRHRPGRGRAGRDL